MLHLGPFRNLPGETVIKMIIRPFLLLISAVSFGLGISLPLMTFEKLWFFSETPSLLGIIADLWTGGEILLFLVVLSFSILFPLVKMFTVFQAVFLKYISSAASSALVQYRPPSSSASRPTTDEQQQVRFFFFFKRLSLTDGLTF